MPTIKASEPWIAVHIGAGFHSQERSDSYRGLCKDAIESAWLHRATSFHSKLNLSKFICDAISVLEVGKTWFLIYRHDSDFLYRKDSPLTNAGFGSNLTLYGDVECDAALVDGQGQSGAVGAIRGIFVISRIFLRRGAHRCACRCKESDPGCGETLCRRRSFMVARSHSAHVCIFSCLKIVY